MKYNAKLEFTVQPAAMGIDPTSVFEALINPNS